MNLLIRLSCVLDSFNDLYSSYVIFYLLLLSVVVVIISIFNVEFYAGEFSNVNRLKNMQIYFFMWVYITEACVESV